MLLRRPLLKQQKRRQHMHGVGLKKLCPHPSDPTPRDQLGPLGVGPPGRREKKTSWCLSAPPFPRFPLQTGRSRRGWPLLRTGALPDPVPYLHLPYLAVRGSRARSRHSCPLPCPRPSSRSTSPGNRTTNGHTNHKPNKRPCPSLSPSTCAWVGYLRLLLCPLGIDLSLWWGFDCHLYLSNHLLHYPCGHPCHPYPSLPCHPSCLGLQFALGSPPKGQSLGRVTTHAGWSRPSSDQTGRSKEHSPLWLGWVWLLGGRLPLR